MMRLLNFIKFDLIKLSRDKTALVFMVILPVVFILIFGTIKFTGAAKIPVGITNNDKGEMSKELLQEISNDKAVSFTEMKEEELLSKVQNANVEAGFVIPENFSKSITDGKTPEIKLVKLRTSENFAVIQNVITSALTKMSIKEGVDGYVSDKLKNASLSQKQMAIEQLNKNISLKLKEPDLISVETTVYSDSRQAKDYDTKAFVTIGFMIMFVMMTIIFSGAGVILEQKKDNTWNRLITTPTRRSSIMLGNILSSFIKGWIQVTFLVLFSKFVLGLNWGQSFSALMIIMSVFIISVTGLSLFMASIIKTNAQLSVIASIVVTCTTMVSGCYWPLEVEPQFMQDIAVLFPQYWAMKGMRNVIENNLGIESVILPALALLVIGVIFFTASIVISGGFKLEIKKTNTKGTGIQNTAY